jgi:hypothetical protein
MSSAAEAGLLTVNLAGLDVRFKGNQTDIVDDAADAFNTLGNMNPLLGDSIDAATFKNNNVLVDSWMAPPDVITADLLIQDGLASLAANTPVVVPLAGGTNDFFWFVDDGTKLRLSFNSLTVQRTVLGAGLPEIFLMTGAATVTEQNLPGGLAFDNMVAFAYVSTDAMFIPPNNIDGLATSGVVTITGDMAIPEPSTVFGGCVCVVLAGIRCRHLRSITSS